MSGNPGEIRQKVRKIVNKLRVFGSQRQLFRSRGAVSSSAKGFGRQCEITYFEAF
jgi:hypothetical protein